MEAHEVPLPEQGESADHFDLPPITVAYVRNVPPPPPRADLIKETICRAEERAYKLYIIAACFWLGLLCARLIVEHKED